MLKPAERILSDDARQCLNERLSERLSCACTHPPQDGFQFGESLLNGGEIGRVGRQKQEMAPSAFDDLFDPRSQVNREIVQDHDLPRTQAGSKDLLDVGLKGGSVR